MSELRHESREILPPPVVKARSAGDLAADRQHNAQPEAGRVKQPSYLDIKLLPSSNAALFLGCLAVGTFITGFAVMWIIPMFGFLLAAVLWIISVVTGFAGFVCGVGLLLRGRYIQSIAAILLSLFGGICSGGFIWTILENAQRAGVWD